MSCRSLEPVLTFGIFNKHLLREDLSVFPGLKSRHMRFWMLKWRYRYDTALLSYVQIVFKWETNVAPTGWRPCDHTYYRSTHSTFAMFILQFISWWLGKPRRTASIYPSLMQCMYESELHTQLDLKMFGLQIYRPVADENLEMLYLYGPPRKILNQRDYTLTARVWLSPH